MTPPEIVLFDIGNVLIEWQPERFFDRVMPSSERKRMFDTVDLHRMNDRIDRGANFRETIYQTALENPEFEGPIRMWHDNWPELAAPAIPRSVALNRALRAKGVHTAILSNIGHETHVIASKKYPFLSEFDRHFVSAQMECIKPEPRIYQMVEESYGVPPNTLLFTDDRLENIESAKSRGWQTHHFTGPQGWANALVDHGLLTQDEAHP